MKKLNRLQINSEKLMKNEELMVVKGGYSGGMVVCEYEDLSECNAGYYADCSDNWGIATICKTICGDAVVTGRCE